MAGKRKKERRGGYGRKYDRKVGKWMSGEERGKGGKEGKERDRRLWEEI